MPHIARPRQVPTTVTRRRVRSHGAHSRHRGPAHDPSSTADAGPPILRSQRLARSVKQFAQVAVATLLVAGGPIAMVWWLRTSGTISSAVLCVLLGIGLSLCASQLGCVLWEKRPGSEDLLFSELMIWGYLHRLRTQHRLASALDTLGPMTETQRRVVDGLSTKERAKHLERLVAGMETRDPYLHGHSRRVARHSWMIARRMGLSGAHVALIRTAATIHDVGKIKTPKTILHKTGRLTDAEYEVIKKHPGDGALMAAVLGDPELTSMVRHHHERLDGTGYPDSLSGEEIPLGARIIAVADTFDAITSKRPYRPASSHKRAIDILKDEAGAKLDPAVVRAFCGHYAGRRPLVLWAFVAGLPERVLSWLGGSVAGVASAAKVAAVAALVGGAAVTSSTLGLPVAKHDLAKTRSESTAGRQAQIAGAAAVKASTIPGPAVAPRSRHSIRVRHAAVTPGVRNGAAAAGATAAQPSALHAAGGGASQVTGPGGGEGVAGGKSEGPKRKAEETPSKGKTENPSKGKGEETPNKGKTESPSTGKSEEPVGKGKTESPSTGKGEEPVGKGKTESPSTGKSEEAHGKSEEAHGKIKEVVKEVKGKVGEVLGKVN
jgi:HD domain